MALSASAFSAALLLNLSGLGYNGARLSDFCTAIGTGVVNTAKFLTGTENAPGLTGTSPSAGTGIVISGSNVASTIKSQCISAWGSSGTELQNFCTAIGTVVQAQFALASLASTGNGNAIFPSFSGAISTMASAIQAAASFTGARWASFCTAIATGICNEIGANGTGVLSGSTGITTAIHPVVIS